MNTASRTQLSRKAKGRRSRPEATVIVPTYDRAEYLKGVLISLLGQNFPAEAHEIIVVDNKPGGDARHVVDGLIEERHRFIRYIEEPRIGLHHARHRGAQEARGKILVYVDDDIIAHPNWLATILEPFDDPLVAITGGKILPRWEAQPPAWLSQFPPSYLSLLDLGEHRKQLKWPDGMVYGCNLAVRRTILYQVGGFNPDAIGNAGFAWSRGDGETGLCKKVYDAGYKVIYEPAAYVWHRIPAARLEARAFYRRGLMVGLSLSYSHVRATVGERFFILRIVQRSFFAFVRTIRCYVRSLFQRDAKIRYISDACLWYGYGIQHIGVLLNPRLRAFLVKDSYF
jgi:glycosyltransferase involved in cell wall biosynthesis